MWLFNVFGSGKASIAKADMLLEEAICEYENLDPSLFNKDFRRKLKHYIAQLKHIQAGMIISRE